jgi:uncharacterized protein (TIGR03118 family)
MKHTNRLRKLPCALAACAVLAAAGCGEEETTPDGGVVQRDAGVGTRLTAVPLVSDQTGVANHTDPKLINAWGLAFGATGVAWVNANGSGVTQLYDASGNPVSALPSVNLPAPAGATVGTSPTGIVFNAAADSFGGDAFIMATEDGTIVGWQQADGTNATMRVDNSATGAVYKGLALAGSGSNRRLYAADFHNNRIAVYDSNYAPVTLSGAFPDPSMPAGFAPFNIALINDRLYIAYAKQDADAKDDVKGLGNGIVNTFDLNGGSGIRLITTGSLDSPWGMVLAPGGFGVATNMLLVGNFGDGKIHAYDPNNGSLIATMTNADGSDLVVDGLWALVTGPVNSQLFYTAGPADETHGVFGRLDH